MIPLIVSEGKYHSCQIYNYIIYIYIYTSVNLWIPFTVVLENRVDRIRLLRMSIKCFWACYSNILLEQQIWTLWEQLTRLRYIQGINKTMLYFFNWGPNGSPNQLENETEQEYQNMMRKVPNMGAQHALPREAEILKKACQKEEYCQKWAKMAKRSQNNSKMDTTRS